MTAMPPFPSFPSREDWHYAARAVYQHVPSPFAECLYERLFPKPGSIPHHADPLGRLVACARDVMRTRHTRTPSYQAYLAGVDTERHAVAAAVDAERARRARETTAKERAQEAAFYAEGGTAIEWAIQQEATEQTKVDDAMKRTTSRMRAKARSTPTRKRTRATAPKTKDTP